MQVSTSLQVFLQMVAENVNKATLYAVAIVNQYEKGSAFSEINNVITNIFGVTIKYEKLSREVALKKQNNFLKDVDLVLVQNLSTDDNVSYKMFDCLMCYLYYV